MADRRDTDPYTETSNEYNTINNFWNLKREEENFLAQNHTKFTISYENLFHMNQSCKFDIVSSYYKFQQVLIIIIIHKFVSKLIKLINLTA